MAKKLEQDDKKAVFGIYPSRSALEAGVNRLKADGFFSADISVLMPNKEGSQKFAHDNSTKAPEGATTGAGAGLVVGGALGWLVGIGSLAIPGVGPLIAAGPIVALLAGAGTGAAVGGIAGGLVGFGIPEYEAKRYAGYINDGGILLSVHTSNADEIKKAKMILEQTGATDISTNDEVNNKSVKETRAEKDRTRV
ncbi:hypothetical protein [Pseudobdellovibrio exovorus]|uniref:General stress protein 17M-like domain-containing protein n=1 Tax=Pseudobdellovibrio exovorus JSS TaxID=1184267 RepID=M4V5L2_9BACT|nr:hypothetical protein [Pseudobdellovibrio exovorus]AGH94463.1 hypothetical protein A11Q_243 [Pseudobdellovibrio exovorus JSS]